MRREKRCRARSETAAFGLFVVGRWAGQVKHVVNDLLGGGDVPRSKRALTAVADGGGEDSVATDGEVYRLKIARWLLRDERDGKGRIQSCLLRIAREQKECTEHVLVSLAIP